MKQMPAAILKDLAGRFGYEVDALTKFGGGREDSDGVVYRTTRQSEDFVLKIVGAQAKDPGIGVKTEARAAFFAYLGEGGISVVAPVGNDAGHLVEIAADGDDGFIAYQYRFEKGEHPWPQTWNDGVLKAWGRTIGAAHRLAKTYPIWQGIQSSDGGPAMLMWQGEMDNFIAWCKDEDVKAVWRSLREKLDAMPQTRDTVGFIHNDPHMQNVLFDGDRVKLLDFDVSTCHFFACDLAIAIQSALFTTSGGLDRPVGDRAALGWFVDTLLAGYAQENAVSDTLLDDIELFIQYRRALLFTVMQEWLAGNPEARASWKRMLLESPRILHT